jgi:hypothetical protein
LRAIEYRIEDLIFMKGAIMDVKYYVERKLSMLLVVIIMLVIFAC